MSELKYLGGYRIVGLIGSGAFGIVYRAEDPLLRRQVALKVLHPHLAADEAIRARFLRESRLAASLEHPNIVTIYATGENQGRLYTAMQLVTGENLRGRLSKGRMPVAEALAVLDQVAQALDAAHDKGMVHRDVKPENILLRPSSKHVFLADFGIALMSDPDAARMTSSVGTLAYCAPEAVDPTVGVDRRSDIYSLGCLAYECLTGSQAFKGRSLSEVLRDENDGAPASVTETVPELTSAVDETLRAALRHDKEERPSSATGFLSDLRFACSARPLDVLEVEHDVPAANPKDQRQVGATLGDHTIAHGRPPGVSDPRSIQRNPESRTTADGAHAGNPSVAAGDRTVVRPAKTSPTAESQVPRVHRRRLGVVELLAGKRRLALLGFATVVVTAAVATPVIRSELLCLNPNSRAPACSKVAIDPSPESTSAGGRSIDGGLDTFVVREQPWQLRVEMSRGGYCYVNLRRPGSDDDIARSVQGRPAEVREVGEFVLRWTRSFGTDCQAVIQPNSQNESARIIEAPSRG